MKNLGLFGFQTGVLCNKGSGLSHHFGLSAFVVTLGLFICLFGVLRRFQHYTGHITTGSWKGRGNQYI